MSGQYPVYFLRIDGKWAVYDDGTPAGAEVKFSPGTVFGSALWMPEGGHRFEVVHHVTGTALDSGRVELASGAANHVVFFARGGVFTSRFFSTNLGVPSAVQRLTLLNALPTGQAVEFVTCTDFASATSQNCTAVSDPVAYGEVSTRDFPSSGGEVLGFGSTSSGVYFRTLPTASLPASEAEPFAHDMLADQGQAVFFTAPRFTHPNNGRIAEAL